ncbi:hypothetical protein N7450_008645 [Penicillium hetheringtonii]|uniref:Uncharacterized protein n=1 Tax=Penicillium hetheringtonii TaxID=911720 RepID=A0AAD6DD91_9EURO|nr:hypothetical protein N7450_008645 [Penicillium hetheringtonii]
MSAITRHVCHTHANLPISLWKTLSLTLALFYLQLIYAISFIARPFWSSNLDFPPFRQTIERAETFVIDIILDIVPTSQYRSPAPTNINDDAIGRRSLLAFQRPIPLTETSPRVVTNASVPTVPPKMPQCYPKPPSVHGQPSSNQKEIQTETMRSTHTERFTKTNDSGTSIYGTAKKTSTSTRPKLSSMFEKDQKHHANQPVQPGPGPGPGPGLGPDTFTETGTAAGNRERVTTTVTQEEEHEEEELTVHIMEISPRADSGYDTSQPTAPVTDLPKPIVPMEKSPASSFDGPGEVDTGKAPHDASSHYTNDSSLSLGASRAAKSHSTESYPGQFPVSDGVEYSSLATAEYAFRERGTTSARPFSDY